MTARSPSDRPRSSRVLVVLVASTVPLSNGMSGTVEWLWRLMVLVCIGGFIVTHRWTLDRRMWIWQVAAALAVVAAASGLSEAVQPSAHARASVLVVVQWLLLPPVCLWIARRPGHVRAMTLGFLAGQTLSALAAITSAVFDGISIGRSSASDRLQGLAGHPNVLGVLSAVACVIVADAILRRRAGPGIVALGLVHLLALLLSGSVTALAALCLGAVALIMGGEAVSRTVLRSLGVVLLCTVVYSGLVGGSGLATPLDRIRQTSGQTEAISTLAERVETWRYALGQIASDPLRGVGLDDESGRTPVRGIVVHNIVLRSWFQGGAALGAAVLLLLGSVALRIARCVRRKVGVAPAAVALTLVSFSLTSAALQQAYYWMVVIAAWALMVASTSVAGVGTSGVVPLVRRPVAVPEGPHPEATVADAGTAEGSEASGEDSLDAGQVVVDADAVEQAWADDEREAPFSDAAPTDDADADVGDDAEPLDEELLGEEWLDAAPLGEESLDAESLGEEPLDDAEASR